VAHYLSAEWHQLVLDHAVSLPARPGVSAVVACVVSGSPTGDVRYFQDVEDGRIVAQGLGERPGADFTVTSTWADAVQILSGEVDPNVAFMQGRMKVAGNMAKLMVLLPLTVSDDYRAMQAKLRALTEF
jgi:alkyl sulfatase BDS1-like metallo-beta-lactamase superfamily hydrolase